MIVSLDQAIQQLRQGDVIAYPTEAVWGLGCDPYNQSATEKLLNIKQRQLDKGLILVAANMQQAMPFLSTLSSEQLHAIELSWLDAPEERATTWLVPLSLQVPTWISGGHDRVALRVSHHPIVQELCLGFGGVIVSTSANPSGQPAAATEQEVVHYFPQLSLVQGSTQQHSQPSKIIDAISGNIIRA